MELARPATLQDVADLCGISRGTASRALTGDGRVSPETRARVRAAAEQLSYSTNSGARNLRRARAGSIGLWLPRGLRFMEYYMNFAFGVAESTQDRELTVSLISGDFPARKAHSLHVDGFVMADVDGHDELARAILQSGKPVVASELVPPGMPEPTAAICGDHAAATNLVLDGLRDGGATRVAVLTPAVDQTWVQSVNRAAAEWSTATGIDVFFTELVGIPTATELREVVRAMLADNVDVDAIVCVPEGLAVGVLSTLRELGHPVPDSIQVVSYVDSPTMPIVQPPISALDLRPREAGDRAGQILISIIENGGTLPESASETESFDLIYRERLSTRRPTR